MHTPHALLTPRGPCILECMLYRIGADVSAPVPHCQCIPHCDVLPQSLLLSAPAVCPQPSFLHILAQDTQTVCVCCSDVSSLLPTVFQYWRPVHDTSIIVCITRDRLLQADWWGFAGAAWGCVLGPGTLQPKVRSSCLRTLRSTFCPCWQDCPASEHTALNCTACSNGALHMLHSNICTRTDAVLLPCPSRLGLGSSPGDLNSVVILEVVRGAGGLFGACVYTHVHTCVEIMRVAAPFGYFG